MEISVGILVFGAIQGAYAMGYFSLPSTCRQQVEPWVKMTSLVLSTMGAGAAMISSGAVVAVLSFGIGGAVVVTIGVHKRYRTKDLEYGPTNE